MNTFNTFILDITVSIIDFLYRGRDYQRFWVLEEIAREEAEKEQEGQRRGDEWRAEEAHAQGLRERRTTLREDVGRDDSASVSLIRQVPKAFDETTIAPLEEPKKT